MTLPGRDSSDGAAMADGRIVGTLGALIGFAAFWIIIGPTGFNPRKIEWLYGGDPTTYFLGGAFFQRSPWYFPPGLNPHYGLDLANSIYLTDGMPLLAYPAKLISHITGKVYQYVGIWLMLCMTLQGLFGALLAARFTRSVLICLSTAALFVFMPEFLSRFLQLAHHPLACQFTLIAALLIYFLPQDAPRRRYWVLLTIVSLLGQAYLFAMVFGIWVADAGRRLVFREERALRLAVETVAILVTAYAVLWLSGFFVIKSGLSAGGFGVFKANLLSIFDSKPSFMAWSYVLPRTPRTSEDHNAPNFMGLGLMLILAAILLAALARPRALGLDRRHWPLAVMVTGMFLFALSNNIAIGSYEIQIPISSALLNIANLLRVSERFVWPFLYLLPVIGIVILLRAAPKMAVAGLFVVAAGLQIADSHAGWGGTAGRISQRGGREWPIKLKSAFWEAAAKGDYRHLRRYPMENAREGYGDLAYYALTHGMRTNTIYQSRYDDVLAARKNSSIEAELRAGLVDPKAIYVLDARYREAAKAGLKPADLLADIDGHVIFVPGWQNCAPCRAAFNP